MNQLRRPNDVSKVPLDHPASDCPTVGSLDISVFTARPELDSAGEIETCEKRHASTRFSGHAVETTGASKPNESQRLGRGMTSLVQPKRDPADSKMDAQISCAPASRFV